MSEMLLLPTPNWFISRPIDILERDLTVALSVINSVVVTADLFNSLAFSIKDAHSKRINGVAFYQGTCSTMPDAKLLATCSEDLDVKVWNVTSDRSVVASHKLHQNVPTCLDWLDVQNVGHSFFLVSGDNKGNIFKWSPITNTHVRYFPENKPITQLKACQQGSLVAVGYAQGTIVILNMDSDQTKPLFKFKNHEESVNCLNW